MKLLQKISDELEGEASHTMREIFDWLFPSKNPAYNSRALLHLTRNTILKL